MQQSNQGVQNYQEGEIDLKRLVNNLLEKKILIIVFTGFFTVLAALYSTSLQPTYQGTISLKPPSDDSITNLNRLPLINKMKESVFTNFLINLSSESLQYQAFVENNLITKPNLDLSLVDDSYIYATLQSIKVEPPQLTIELRELNWLFEPPYLVTMSGGGDIDIASYLNTLVSIANSKTISDIISLSILNTDIRLEEISIKRKLLLEGALKTRSNEIARIKETSNQNIRQIIDEISRERYKEKHKRLNRIEAIQNSIKIAKTMGVIDHNFDTISNEIPTTVVFGGNGIISPEWYLYGEKALKKQLELLENRLSDDPYIPQLVELNTKLMEAKNNNLLITLQERVDDTAFIDEITQLELEAEEMLLKASVLIHPNTSAFQQIKSNDFKTILPNKRLILMLTFFGSLMTSILLSLFLVAIKPVN